LCQDDTIGSLIPSADNGNNKITELRTILQRENDISKQTSTTNNKTQNKKISGRGITLLPPIAALDFMGFDLMQHMLNTYVQSDPLSCII
jgi:hypothetical protein